MRKALVILLFTLFTTSTGLMVYFFLQHRSTQADLKKSSKILAAVHVKNKADSDKLFEKVKQKEEEKASLGEKLKELGSQLNQVNQSLTNALSEHDAARSQVAALHADLKDRDKELKTSDDELVGVKGQLDSFRNLAESERQRAAKFVELSLSPDEILALKDEYDTLLKKSEALQQRFKANGLSPDELLTRFQTEAKSALTRLSAIKSLRPVRAERIAQNPTDKRPPKQKSLEKGEKTVPNPEK